MNTKKLLFITKKVDNLYNKVYEVFGDFQELGFILDTLNDLILDEYGVPKDTTVEICKKYSTFEKATQDKDFFCRDFFSELLRDYYDEKITAEKLEIEISLKL